MSGGNGAFPQKFDQEQFKDFLNRAYKAGAIDSLTESVNTIEQYLKITVIPDQIKQGYEEALILLRGFIVEAETRLKGEYKPYTPEELAEGENEK